MDEANELQQIKIEAKNLPLLGRDALRKLHGVEFLAKAAKQSMIANRTGDRAGVPRREPVSGGGSRIAADEANARSDRK